MASLKGVLALIKAAKPLFNSKGEKLVYLTHAVFSLNGLRLIGISEGNFKDLKGTSPEISTDGWNDKKGTYNFIYGMDEGNEDTVSLKCEVSGDIVSVNIRRSRDQKQLGYELKTEEYVLEESDIRKTFTDKVDDLVRHLQVAVEEACDVTSAIDPSTLANAGKAPSSFRSPFPGSSIPASSSSSSTPSNDNDDTKSPSLISENQPIRLPAPDPIDRDGVRVPPQLYSGPPPPLGVGGFGGPGAGGRGGFVGMHVGPNDPLFAGRMRHPELVGGGGGFGRGGYPGMGGMGGVPLGGEGGVPLPPGARWDPINPAGLQGWRPEDFQKAKFPPGKNPDFFDIGQPGPGRGADWDNMFG